MKDLSDYKQELNMCSKCGFCQAACPIYKITKNDCSVSRGQFIMLQGLLKGQLKLTKKINYYIDLCLKCGACSKFCPSGIDAVDVMLAAKSEVFKNSLFEKTISLIQKFVINHLLKLPVLFKPKYKTKNFEKKVLYFGGCGSKLNGADSVIKILNLANIEVLTPDFNCCGIPFLMRGDKESFCKYLENFIKTIESCSVREIVTTCASCEKTLRDYMKFSNNPVLKELKIKNIYEYLRENNLQLSLKKTTRVTFHKPCNVDNYEDIKLLLENIKNLHYVEMNDFDACCGLNGILKFDKYNVLTKLFKAKRKNILDTNCNIVLTSCLCCEVALKSYSLNNYRVYDLISFLAKNLYE